MYCTCALMESEEASCTLEMMINGSIHAFFYNEPTSRPSSKSSLFVDLKSANCSTKSSLIVP